VPGDAWAVRLSNASPDVCAMRCRSVDPSGPAGWSHSTAPSSTAISTAYATSGFVTDASGNGRSTSP
jgi:hypothetical protein